MEFETHCKIQHRSHAQDISRRFVYHRQLKERWGGEINVCRVVWYVARYGYAYGMVWYGMWYGMDMVWYSVVWLWYGVV